MPLTGSDIARYKDVCRALFKQLFILFNKGFGPEDVVEFNKGKEFVGVTPVVADRPLKEELIEEVGDPSQFLEYACRSLQQATIPSLDNPQREADRADPCCPAARSSNRSR